MRRTGSRERRHFRNQSPRRQAALKIELPLTCELTQRPTEVKNKIFDLT